MVLTRAEKVDGAPAVDPHAPTQTSLRAASPPKGRVGKKSAPGSFAPDAPTKIMPPSRSLEDELRDFNPDVPTQAVNLGVMLDDDPFSPRATDVELSSFSSEDAEAATEGPRHQLDAGRGGEVGAQRHRTAVVVGDQSCAGHTVMSPRLDDEVRLLAGVATAPTGAVEELHSVVAAVAAEQLLDRVGRLLLDPRARLTYDFKKGYVFAEERLALAVRKPAGFVELNLADPAA
mgnify:CR=1 FL=1